jgi:hypothetical protein
VRNGKVPCPRRRGCRVQKIPGREDPAPATGFDPLEDLAVNGFCVLAHLLLSEKICSFSDKNKSDF